MAKPDWLSIEEISRLWGEETGLDAGLLDELGEPTDIANRLMGIVGAHLVERTTFEAYCEERGHPMPRFWLGGRVEGSPRDKPSQSEPSEISPEATAPQPSEERSYVREESDPEAAYQARVAWMSEKLNTLWDESPDVSRQSVPDQQGLEAGSGQTGTSAEPNQQELIERVDAASAKARELKAQLEVAEQRFADLTAEAEASRASSMARPYGPVPASPEAPFQEPKTSPGFLRRGSENYGDSSATHRMPRQTTARWKGRGRVILVAGLAIPLVALLFWDVETMIQPAGNEQIPPTTETADPMAGSGSADGGQPPVQPETAALSLELATGKLDLEGAVPQADAQALAAAQHQIAHLTASVKALETARQRIADLNTAVGSEEEAAKLREELSARQQEAAAPQQPTGPGATAPSDQNPVADQKGPDQVQNAEISSDSVTSETDALRDTVSLERLLPFRRPTRFVSLERLLLEPGVVTGSVIWLGTAGK